MAGKPGPDHRNRARDSAATRRAILDAALSEFSRSGFDGAGTRDIARAAGVDARLITRYFGSKEGLFARVVEEIFGTPLITAAGGNRPAARDSLTATSAEPDPMMLVLRSAPNPQAAEIMRRQLEASSQRHLAGQLPGDDAAARAALLLSMCTGVRMYRSILGNSALRDADTDRMTDYFEAALDVVASPQPPARPPRQPNTSGT